MEVAKQNLTVNGVDNMVKTLTPLITRDKLDYGKAQGDDLTSLVEADPRGFNVFADACSLKDSGRYPLESAVVIGKYVEVDGNIGEGAVRDLLEWFPTCMTIKNRTDTGTYYYIKSVGQILKTWKAIRSPPPANFLNLGAQNRVGTFGSNVPPQQSFVPTPQQQLPPSPPHPLQHHQSHSSCSQCNESDDWKTPCRYGADCYEKNPEHFKKYSHPTFTKPKKKSKSHKVGRCFKKLSKSYKKIPKEIRRPIENKAKHELKKFGRKLCEEHGAKDPDKVFSVCKAVLKCF